MPLQPFVSKMHHSAGSEHNDCSGSSRRITNNCPTNNFAIEPSTSRLPKPWIQVRTRRCTQMSIRCQSPALREKSGQSHSAADCALICDLSFEHVWAEQSDDTRLVNLDWANRFASVSGDTMPPTDRAVATDVHILLASVSACSKQPTASYLRSPGPHASKIGCTLIATQPCTIAPSARIPDSGQLEREFILASNDSSHPLNADVSITYSSADMLSKEMEE